MPSNDVEKATLVFGTRGGTTTGSYSEIRMTHCEVSATYVETEIECIRASAGGALRCAASRIREAPGMPHSNWSSLNIQRSFTGNYLSYIPDTIQSAHRVTPSGLESYLQDPPTSFSDGTMDIHDFGNISMDVFQARLALIVNTFYHASLNTSNFLGADGVGLYHVPWNYANQYGNTSGTWTEFTPPRYEVKFGWFALYLAGTTVLAICAIVTVVMTVLTRAPDLFGGVSSLTRDSAFVTGVPDGGSSLSGSERARLLKDLWVKIQDVKPEREVGRIAFSDRKELEGTARLRWDRKYE
ncbi:hypothetical protein BK809_0000156 [Diplodia seriata]|uniref:Uncharacterized protein n=1 Tax=Diplodia seriata TaxID=420778 RepID=A0A1S8BA09_9PEZI|nr:hypothetical protein BK809_0000156 [Diplodia seriata]